LGNPRWVTEKVHAAGGFVYHDVVDRKWAMKALDSGVDGIICVNNRAGGHAGQHAMEKLFSDMHDLHVPLIAAGGLSTGSDIKQALLLGYQGVQLGTRFIATTECTAHLDYKKAIVAAHEADIVLSEKITGVPVAVINTESVKRLGLKANPLARYMLGHPKMKHWVRMFYTLQSAWKLKEASTKGFSHSDFWQAGKSVEGIDSVVSVADVMAEFRTQLA
jgi:nitronate monooxygenase